MKTLSVEKARENYEKAKEKAETLQAKTEAAVKHMRKCEADLVESENAEYIRIVREMNLSIEELRAFRNGRLPVEELKEKNNEEVTRINENESTHKEAETEREDGMEQWETIEGTGAEEDVRSIEKIQPGTIP